MNLDAFSPYVRVAMYSDLAAPFKIKQRIIFDFELIFIAEGSWRLTMDGKPHLCQKNDVILLKPGVSHSIENAGDHSVSQPHVHFDVIYDEQSSKVPVSFLDRDQMSREEIVMIRKDVLSQLPSPFLNISDPNYFKHLLYDVIDCYCAKEPLYQLKCKGKMLVLLTYILQENGASANQDQGRQDIIVLIKNFIDQNYCNEITLDSLEKQFHYSKFYIAKQFSKKYSYPIIKYYQALRIEAAKRDLMAGLSVTQIAEKLNMSSIYAFSRFFKSKAGVSPSQFRNKELF